MLTKQLRGESFNKSAHRRNLANLLNSRSERSIESKHQNISAVLIRLGYPNIPGYKPLFNYQHLLGEMVIQHIASNENFEEAVGLAVDAPAKAAQVSNILKRLVPPPEPNPVQLVIQGVAETRTKYFRQINYLEREARNASLGLAGELFVLQYERARLIDSGQANLADRVEHTSVELGDGAGFDIRSFETNGRDRLIEVKTTAYGKYTPFYVSSKELRVSQNEHECYHLFRVFEYRNHPKIFTLNGRLDQICHLEPSIYVTHVS